MYFCFQISIFIQINHFQVNMKFQNQDIIVLFSADSFSCLFANSCTVGEIAY